MKFRLSSPARKITESQGSSVLSNDHDQDNGHGSIMSSSKIMTNSITHIKSYMMKPSQVMNGVRLDELNNAFSKHIATWDI